MDEWITPLKIVSLLMLGACVFVGLIVLAAEHAKQRDHEREIQMLRLRQELKLPESGT